MGNGGAKSPTLGRDRSNKLKEVLDGGGRGYPGNRRKGSAGWKTVNTCRNWDATDHRFRSLFIKQQVIVARTLAPVTRATPVPTNRGTNRVSRACV